MGSSSGPPLIHTKLNPPRVAGGVVARPRLFEQLEAGSRLALTLVSAPAGYGKSTLVADWLTTSGKSFGWLSLDESESDPILFLRYLLGAFRDTVPQVEFEVGSALEVSQSPAARELVALLINDLQALDEDLILVLDDYHSVREPAVHELLTALLRHPPRRLHLMILTRADPPLPLISLGASGQAVEIRLDDLRFSEDEARNFLEETLDRELDAATLTRLVATTEGWAVGLHLAGLGLRRSADPAGYLAGSGAAPPGVTGFLMSEVVGGLSPDELQALLSVSILRRFCASLCDAVLSELDLGISGEEFLGWLRQSGLFVCSLDEREEWYRFHHLFSDLLEHELGCRFDDARVAELHLRAATWLSEQDLLEEAIDHYRDAGRTELAAELVKRNRQELMSRDQWHRLERLLNRLDREKLRDDVELLVQRAWMCEHHSQYAAMIQKLEEIEGILASDSSSEPTAAVQGEIDAIAALRAYLSCDSSRAEALARRAVDHLPTGYQSARGFALVILAFSLQLSGRFGLARKVAVEELANLNRHSASLRARILIGLCFVHSMEGETESVARFARELLAMGEDLGLAEAASFGRYHLGVALWDRNEPQAIDTLAPFESERFHPNLANYFHGLYLLSLGLEQEGQGGEARALLDSLAARALELHTPELLELAEAFGAELALRQRRVRSALPWARRFEPRVQGPWWRCFLPELTWIRVMHAAGEEAERRQAEQLLEALRENMIAQHQHRLLAEVLALQALHRLHSRGEEEALALVREAVALARPHGRVRPFLDLGPEMARLVGRLGLELAPGGFKETSRTPAAGPTASVGPDALTHRELDVLELLAGRLSNKEIGARLHISSATVKRHTANIYQKLHVHGRRQAVERACDLGILPSA